MDLSINEHLDAYFSVFSSEWPSRSDKQNDFNKIHSLAKKHKSQSRARVKNEQRRLCQNPHKLPVNSKFDINFRLEIPFS
jgi:predicted NUDIX family NTP pyrophosphohydrolase